MIGRALRRLRHATARLLGLEVAAARGASRARALRDREPGEAQNSYQVKDFLRARHSFVDVTHCSARAAQTERRQGRTR